MIAKHVVLSGAILMLIGLAGLASQQPQLLVAVVEEHEAALLRGGTEYVVSTASAGCGELVVGSQDPDEYCTEVNSYEYNANMQGRLGVPDDEVYCMVGTNTCGTWFNQRSPE